MDGTPPESPSPELPKRTLTATERAELNDDGVTCLRQILPQQWLDRIARGIERAGQSTSDIGELVSMKDQGYLGDLFMWLHDDDFRSIVFESPLALLAKQAMGSTSARHWYDQLFVKEPGAQVPTPWHHDLTFWPIAGNQIISFWIPLDPVSREMSGLEYVKGSHRWPNRFKAVTPDYNEYMLDPALEDVPDIDANRDAFDLVDWEMEPGDVLAFHPLIIHGSAGNQSTTTSRRALASRWAGDDVVFVPRKHTMPLPPGHGLEPGQPLGGSMFPTVVT